MNSVEEQLEREIKRRRQDAVCLQFFHGNISHTIDNISGLVTREIENAEAALQSSNVEEQRRMLTKLRNIAPIIEEIDSGLASLEMLGDKLARIIGSATPDGSPGSDASVTNSCSPILTMTSNNSTYYSAGESSSDNATPKLKPTASVPLDETANKNGGDNQALAIGGSVEKVKFEIEPEFPQNTAISPTKVCVNQNWAVNKKQCDVAQQFCLHTRVRCEITHIESPSSFWLRKVFDDELNGFMERTLKLRVESNGCRLIDSPSVGQYCAVRFGDAYLRGQIMALDSDRWGMFAKVFLIDIGRTEECSGDYLNVLPPELESIPRQAVQCFLAKVAPRSTDYWSQENVQLFFLLCSDGEIGSHLEVKAVLNTFGMQQVYLYRVSSGDEYGENIGKLLVELQEDVRALDPWSPVRRYETEW